MDLPENRMKLRVASRKELTADIAEFSLARADGAALAPFKPGAHITVETPSGAMRRYSLVNDGTAPTSYVIAVKRDGNSRGGSASMHADLAEGSEIQVDLPENDFELVEASRYLLIAGGIGITPILSMARKLSSDGKPFQMIYCTRTSEETAYLDEVTALPGALVHHDNGDMDDMYDFWDHFENPGAEHVYCCGPTPLMEEIKAISGHWTEGRVHFEDFAGVAAVQKDDTAFTVSIASSGHEITVPADRTILEALRAAGENTVSSCESGTCGTCKCRLIDGEADHRDLVLMEEEKDDYIMICVSRAKSGDLVVDF